MYCLIAAVVALVAGILIGRQLAGKARLDHEGEATARAQQILRDAEEKGNRLRDEKIKQADERLEQSKNKFKSIRNEFVTTRVRGTAKAPNVTLAPFRSATSAVGSLFGSDQERDKWMNEMERQSGRNTDRLRAVSPVEASVPPR